MVLFLSTFNPYNKAKGSVTVCLFVCVPKDLANHRTDMVLLYSLASHIKNIYVKNLLCKDFLPNFMSKLKINYSGDYKGI